MSTISMLRNFLGVIPDKLAQRARPRNDGDLVWYRFADTAALYQALGGGWWHHSELSTQ